MRRDLSLSAAARALQAMGKLEVVHVTDEPRAMSLREACAARGLDPASYRTPQQKFTALDRLIPGKAERIAPSILIAQRRPELKNINARPRYTETAAAKHASMIRDGGTEAYVALFCQLNNLTI